MTLLRSLARVLVRLAVGPAAAMILANCAAAPVLPREEVQATETFPGIVSLTREQDDMIANR